MKANTIRTSLDIPAGLHRQLRALAVRRGCSARQLILSSLERIVAEETVAPARRISLPLVAPEGRVIRPVSNDEALFS
jgi:hypothetical protein